MAMSMNAAVEEGKMTGGDSEALQVVEFLLGEECFAIDLFDVKEVVEYMTITKLPDTPDFIRGIIDLRGEITTIVDLKERLRIREDHGQSDEENCRIIVMDEKHTRAKIGIMVDDVLSVSTYDRKLVDTTSTSSQVEDSAILGIIKKKIKQKEGEKEKERNELIIWIDINQLLRDIDQYL